MSILILSSVLWVFACVTTFILFPVCLKLIQSIIKPSNHTNKKFIQFEHIHIVMAVYNEEAILKEKLNSILSSTAQIPLTVWIGNDHSQDNSVNIIEQFQDKLNIELVHFSGRNGKIAIINQLMAQIQLNSNQKELAILTDANVIFHPSMISELCSNFTDNTGILSANIIEKQQNAEQNKNEQIYIKSENNLKALESMLAKSMVGAFGGCYALNVQNFQQVPGNFICDDFYQTLWQIKQNRTSEFCSSAIAYEDVPNDFKIEFNRKRRMSSGNIQNMIHFKQLLFKWPFNVLYFFHKLLRWAIPILMILGVFTSFYLFTKEQNIIHTFLLCLNLSSLFGLVYAKLFPQGIKFLSPFNGLAYFFYMNFALLMGYWDVLVNQHSNIWTPTKRNVRS